MGNERESVSLEDVPIELPPAIEQFIGKLKSDRKKLMKDPAFGRPDQLRVYVGTYLYPRLIEAIEMLAGASFDTYALAVSNMNGLQRLHAFTVGHLDELGAELDRDAPLPGVSPEVMDDFQQAFYALGVVLRAKLPEDEEAEGAYNRCAELLGEMVAELMGVDDRDRDDDEEYDDRDDDRDDDDGDKGNEGESESAEEAESSPAEKESPKESPPATEQAPEA